ncbi:alpha/beta fold hydrolase [Sagittula stellata]|uniref:Putative alpha/beta hydrolase n=1 Tax=Sagittula stellata (strain ATCC 700073 / DSM 11524 / E-37) TaxID=388399 RepID=A3K2G2_SAGS3|nr:alpha/beta hydrolase [Sagittula stellata]EBA08371.1 putative alpha/beta hydrolase [Sagittula stellata E-37]
MSTAATLAALALAGLPTVRELRRTPRNAHFRQQAPGRFAELSQGRTHYDWLGPERGATVVCVHGLTTPSYVWLGLARHLVAMGFRVLVYDLYGRGYSDAPRGPQTPGFFTRQLSDLLEHEALTGDFTLAGYSMGGAIAAHWGAANPDRLRRVILLAPAGMGHRSGATARFCTEWPLAGDWLFHMAYPTQFARIARSADDAESSIDDIAGLQVAELRRRGFVRSVLSSLRGTLRGTAEEAHRALHAAQVPVTVIWGRDDTVIPLRAMGQLAQWNRQARQVVIDGAGHGLPWTHTDKVAEAIRETLEAETA